MPDCLQKCRRSDISECRYVLTEVSVSRWPGLWEHIVRLVAINPEVISSIRYVSQSFQKSYCQFDMSSGITLAVAGRLPVFELGSCVTQRTNGEDQAFPHADSVRTMRPWPDGRPRRTIAPHSASAREGKRKSQARQCCTDRLNMVVATNGSASRQLTRGIKTSTSQAGNSRDPERAKTKDSQSENPCKCLLTQ